MNQDVKIMVRLYQTKDKDWMGYKICKNCKLTRHHIFKKVYGGHSDISNYALLVQKSHEYLHILEQKDHKAFIELSNLFRELNESLSPPTEEYYEKVNKILERTRVKKPL